MRRRGISYISSQIWYNDGLKSNMISSSKIKNFNKKFDVVGIFVEYEGTVLFLHRQDHKPQGNTWGVVAGKVDDGEDFLDALVRETKEEIGLDLKSEDIKYVKEYYVRYPEYDFKYHVHHVLLKEKPVLKLELNEHKDSRWLSPHDALHLDLIQDQDVCIKDFYNIS